MPRRTGPNSRDVSGVITGLMFLDHGRGVNSAVRCSVIIAAGLITEVWAGHGGCRVTPNLGRSSSGGSTGRFSLSCRGGFSLKGEFSVLLTKKLPGARTLPHDAGKGSRIMIRSRAAVAGTRAGLRDHVRDRDHGRSPRSGHRRCSVIMPANMITEHRTCRPRTSSSPGMRTLPHDAGKGSPIMITSHPTASMTGAGFRSHVAFHDHGTFSRSRPVPGVAHHRH